MKSLSKTDQDDFRKLLETMAQAANEIQVKVDGVNEHINGELAELISVYNDAGTAVQDFIESIRGRQEEYAGERSDNWRDGEAGSAYAEWMESWNTAEFEPAEEPEEVEVIFNTDPDILSELPMRVK